MYAIRTNANGVSVQGVIPADSAVEDTWTVERHDPQDTLTAAGIAFRQTGACYIELVGEGNQSLESLGQIVIDFGQVGHDKFAESSGRPMEY